MRLYLTALKATDSVTGGFLPAARALGCEVTILTDRPERHPDAVACDVRDPRALIDAIEHLGRPDALFSNSDHLQAETAMAAAYFGLPGKDWRACLTAKNKFLTRRRLAEAGIERVRSVRLGPEDPVPDRPAYPLVVKPREGVASEDVLLVESDLAGAVRAIRQRRPGESLVVEEYLEGPLRTLETLDDSETIRVLGGFATTLGPLPHFVEERLDWAPDGPHEHLGARGGRAHPGRRQALAPAAAPGRRPGGADAHQPRLPGRDQGRRAGPGPGGRGRARLPCHPALGRRMRSREAYLAARVLNALLREDYGRLSSRVGRSRSGVGLTLADGRLVRLAPGAPFQDFVVAPGQRLGLEQVLETLAELADPRDTAGVAAFFEECAAALAALELHDAHLPDVLARKPSYESLAAFADHPVYPTSRARPGLSEADLVAYAPEYAPAFELRWAAVPRRMLEPGSAPALPADVRARELPGDEVLFPVHPLTVGEVRGIAGVRVLEEPRVTVRPTLSMRTVEINARTHLKLPLPTSTLGLLNRRSIKAGTLRDGARAELLLRELADSDVLIADEQTYAHAGHEYLAWMVRRLPAGKVVPVAALAIPGVLADVFVTITLHLAAAAIAFGALPHARASALLRDTLAEALDGYGDDPMARLLRARTLDAARLTGKSMVTAGTLVAKERTGAADVNKFYGTSGPNYLRRA